MTAAAPAEQSTCCCVQSSTMDDICPGTGSPAVDSGTHLSRSIAVAWPLSFQLAHSAPCHLGGYIILVFLLFTSVFLQSWYPEVETTFCSLPTSIRKVASFICPRLRLDFVAPVPAHLGAMDVCWVKRSLQSSICASFVLSQIHMLCFYLLGPGKFKLCVYKSQPLHHGKILQSCIAQRSHYSHL